VRTDERNRIERKVDDEEAKAIIITDTKLIDFGILTIMICYLAICIPSIFGKKQALQLLQQAKEINHTLKKL
jgi:hypothetical protein